MKQEFLSKVGDVVQTLAEKLGVAAEHVYGVLIKQQIVIGISGTVATLFVWIIAGFILRAYFKDDPITVTERCYTMNHDFKYRNRMDYLLTRGDGIPAILIGVLGGSLFCVISVMFFTVFLPHLINPEYYAIKDIMNMINGGRE